MLSCIALFGVYILMCLSYTRVHCLDDGLALTPPMGWMAWERFRCNVDCKSDPEDCIQETLFMEMADQMMCDGYLEAGYKYVCIDDCWMAMERTPEGELQADPKRFPSGIKALAKYVHSKGLKLGIYADFGKYTCEKYPGSIDHLEQDMKTFASWDVDYLKMDGCYARPHQMDKGYPDAWRFLNATGRKIMFSCSWPFYQVYEGIKPDYQKILKYCHLWRNYIDINDAWEHIHKIVDYYGDNQDDLIPAAGPGHWNDPDQLIIGNFALSPETSKSQMALWAILAAPLFMSNDLRKIAPWAKEILLNKEVIAVNQDVLGKQGRRVWIGQQGLEKYTEVWSRKLVNSVAVVLFNRRFDQPVRITTSFATVGFSEAKAFVRDLFLHEDKGVHTATYTARVNPSGVVMVMLCTTKCKNNEF